MIKKINNFFSNVLELVFLEYFPTTIVVILLLVGYVIYFNGG